MSEKKEKRPQYVTPKGEALFPWLRKADDRPINGKPQTPAYKLELKLSSEGFEAKTKAFPKGLKALIDDAVEASHKAAIEDIKAGKKDTKKKLAALTKAYPYSEGEDEEGNSDGTVRIKFKRNASFKNKAGEVIKTRVALFDSGMKQLAAEINPWGGSVVKVSFTMRPYYMPATDKAGVTMDLNAVQVLELKAQGERSADAYGFESEDGYEQAADEDSTGDADTSDGDGDESKSEGGEDASGDDGSGDF